MAKLSQWHYGSPDSAGDRGASTVTPGKIVLKGSSLSVWRTFFRRRDLVMPLLIKLG